MMLNASTVSCFDVYVVKTGLFLGFMGLHEASKIKFLIKMGKDFYDVNGNHISLFKSKKQLIGLNDDAVFCSLYGEDALLYKIYDKEKNEINISKIFGAEAFDMRDFKRTDFFYKAIIRKLYKPFDVCFEFRNKYYKMSAYKGLDYVGIDKDIIIKSGYSLATLKKIETEFELLQTTKDKSKPCEYINKNCQNYDELDISF